MSRTHITSSLDQEKASISLPAEEFADFKNHLETIQYKFTLGKCDRSSYQESFVREVVDDLERVESGSEPYELWMEYWVLEELYHLFSDCTNPTIIAEFKDSLREYEHLRCED